MTDDSTAAGVWPQVSICDVAKGFFGKGWKLHDLKVHNADLHRQLVSAQTALCKACGREDEVEIVRVVRSLIEIWDAIVAAMPVVGPETKSWE